jgi:DNA-binding NtrC family response regulator
VAQKGSLLLDEIDVLGPAQQAKLLRVIETGEFEPVGSNDTRTSRARLIVASNVDLKVLMERNEFRADLYYRLNMLEFRIPPLRERPRDIVPMTLGFIDEFCQNHNVQIRHVHPDFLTCLKRYDWPGNVRELKNHVRRAVLFCRTGMLTPDQLAPHFRESLLNPPAGLAVDRAAGAGRAGESTFVERLALSEREILEQALHQNSHNRTATARSLGLSRVGLYKKMKKYGMITPREPKDISQN